MCDDCTWSNKCERHELPPPHRLSRMSLPNRPVYRTPYVFCEACNAWKVKRIGKNYCKKCGNEFESHVCPSINCQSNIHPFEPCKVSPGITLGPGDFKIEEFLHAPFKTPVGKTTAYLLLSSSRKKRKGKMKV